MVRNVYWAVACAAATRIQKYNNYKKIKQYNKILTWCQYAKTRA